MPNDLRKSLELVDFLHHGSLYLHPKQWTYGENPSIKMLYSSSPQKKKAEVDAEPSRHVARTTASLINNVVQEVPVSHAPYC